MFKLGTRERIERYAARLMTSFLFQRWHRRDRSSAEITLAENGQRARCFNNSTGGIAQRPLDRVVVQSAFWGR